MKVTDILCQAFLIWIKMLQGDKYHPELIT